MFAGEDIECTITFKNIATPPGADRSPVRPSKQNGFAQGGDRQRKVLPLPSSTTRPSISRNSSFSSQLPPPHLRGHKPTLSLNTPSFPGGRRSPVSVGGGNNGSSAPGHKHGRSLSIISLGTDAGDVGHERGVSGPPPRRPARGHGRSASLQVMPGKGNAFSGPKSHCCTTDGELISM